MGVEAREALRVVVAADDPLARAGLSALLLAQPGCEVIGEIGLDQRSSVPLAAGPDVIVADLGRGSGVFGEHIAALEAFNAPVLVLLADRGLGGVALAAGAAGYVHRDASGERIAAALAAVAAGLQVSEPTVRAHDEPIGRRAEQPVFEDLTPRELDVLRLMAEGLPNKTIARRLAISEHTVKFHITAIMGKLDAHSRTEAVTRAARSGLLIL